MFWVTSPAGKRMPLDLQSIAPSAAPSRAVRYTLAPDTKPLKAIVVADAWTASVYVSHFTTCANASSHSRKRRIAAEST